MVRYNFHSISFLISQLEEAFLGHTSFTQARQLTVTPLTPLDNDNETINLFVHCLLPL